MRSIVFISLVLVCTVSFAQEQPSHAQAPIEAVLIEGLEPGPPPPPSTQATRG